MCGVAGTWDRGNRAPASAAELAAMAQSLRHRGPDGFGLYLDGPLGLAHSRLSIIDLEGGRQPMCSASGGSWLSYNGEIYNYLELREELEGLGQRFRTRSDTEVVLGAYEQWGSSCLERLNGAFAFGLWDGARRRLMLARDRLGIRPLFWTERAGKLIFASELKALLCAGVPVEIDLEALEQVFVAWTTIAPRSILAGVRELPAGHMLLVGEKGEPKVERYWDLPQPPAPDELVTDELRAAAELRGLMEDSVRLRLRADVTVGAYLSGGLDSTIATALVRSVTDTPLETYSIAFADAEYDESEAQREAVAALGTRHERIVVDYADIAEAFPAVVRAAEKPILRTAPVPLYLLSALVRRQGRKVVLTGEGADEIFGGYDLFKETKIRAWWSRRPDSRLRPLLLRRLYPFAPGEGARAAAFLEAFYREGIDDVDDPGFSHRPTWRNGRKNRGYFSRGVLERLEGDGVERIVRQFAPGLAGRDALARAEYLETKIFLGGHLLASQGDRMSLGHSVEGRYPFLDHRIVEFGQRLAPRLKLRGLTEKWILREAHRDLLPEPVLRRHKRPYLAPNVRSFQDGPGRELMLGLLTRERILAEGLFDGPRVARLRDRVLARRPLGERETMAAIGILSTLVLLDELRSLAADPPRPALEDFPLQTAVGRSGGCR